MHSVQSLCVSTATRTGYTYSSYRRLLVGLCAQDKQGLKVVGHPLFRNIAWKPLVFSLFSQDASCWPGVRSVDQKIRAILPRKVSAPVRETAGFSVGFVESLKHLRSAEAGSLPYLGKA